MIKDYKIYEQRDSETYNIRFYFDDGKVLDKPFSIRKRRVQSDFSVFDMVFGNVPPSYYIADSKKNRQIAEEIVKQVYEQYG